MFTQEILQVPNPALALRNRSGKFKVTSPNGYIFEVSCRRGRRIRIREVGAPEDTPSAQLNAWQIEKIA